MLGDAGAALDDAVHAFSVPCTRIGIPLWFLVRVGAVRRLANTVLRLGCIPNARTVA